jgi:hypothetical protein
MPEMLRPIEEHASPTPRFAQDAPKLSPRREEAKGILVRGQAPEEPKRSSPPVAKLLMPSPEELGIGSAKETESLDWNAARRKLDSLGATAYRLEKSADGGFCFFCSLPHTNDPVRQRSFESRGRTESEAMQLALGQAEEWRAARR